MNIVARCVCVSWDLVPVLCLSSPRSEYVELSILSIWSSQPADLLFSYPRIFVPVYPLSLITIRLCPGIFPLFSFFLLSRSPPLGSSHVVVVNLLQADTPKADTSS